VPRLLLALRAPAADDPDFAAVRLLATLLGSGRASRLHRSLVDEEQLCAWVAADVADTLDPGPFTVSLELVPGVEPAAVEGRLLAELAALADGGPGAVSGEEIERCRRVLVADWVFAHERVHQQGLAAGFALALFDLGFLERQLAAMLAVDRERLAAAAARWLRPERDGVIGWSLPRRSSAAVG
jgi:zinc protease